MTDILRITHAVDFLAKVPDEENLPDRLPQRHRQEIREQIEKRKKVKRGLDMEINQLEELLEIK